MGEKLVVHLTAPLSGAFLADVAPLEVVIDQTHRLHEGIDGCRTDKRPTPILQVLGYAVEVAVIARISVGAGSSGPAHDQK